MATCLVSMSVSPSVSESMCQTNLVYTYCVIHICLTQRRIEWYADAL